MKGLLLLIFVAFTFNATALVTGPYSNSFNAAGTIIDKDIVFIKVKNAEASATIDNGDVVVLSLVADDGASVLHSATAGIQAHCVAMESIAAGKMGKCQVYGYHSALKFSAAGGSVSAGGPLFNSDDAADTGLAGVETDTATIYKIGEALDAASATGTVEAFIRLL